MNNRYFRSAIFSALIFLVFAGGCSDDDPAVPGIAAGTGLHGVVVDGDGAPLADISIGLIYDLPGLVQGKQSANVIFRPAEKPLIGIGYELPEAGHVRIWITDYAGDFVATLVDEQSDDPTRQMAIWAALDEAGDPVPSGMYNAHVQIDEQETTVQEFFLLFADVTDFLRHANAVTNEQGEFNISDDLIPVGATIEGIDETGTVTNRIVITSEIRVLAVREGDSGTESVSLTIRYVPNGGNGRLELVLP